MARPSKFNDSLKETMLELYKKGKTDKEVAEIIGVCEKTLHNWRGKNPSFLHALRDMKQTADKLVEASLFNRAIGISRVTSNDVVLQGQEVTLTSEKYYPPDTKAAIFWLKNRQPKRWREKLTIDSEKNLTEEQLDAQIQMLLKKLDGPKSKG